MAANKADATKIKPVHMPTFTACMEQLQDGYVAAVAATGGFTLEVVERDVYGLDVEFVKSRGPDLEEVSIRAQLKSTTTVKPDPQQPAFSFRFKKRVHYQHLAKPRSSIKAILLVMVTNPDQSLWTSGTHEALSIQNCCYWANLEGDAVPDVDQPYIQVPTANIFDAAALTAMFGRVEKGDRI